MDAPTVMQPSSSNSELEMLKKMMSMLTAKQQETTSNTLNLHSTSSSLPSTFASSYDYNPSSSYQTLSSSSDYPINNQQQQQHYEPSSPPHNGRAATKLDFSMQPIPTETVTNNGNGKSNSQQDNDELTRNRRRVMQPSVFPQAEPAQPAPKQPQKQQQESPQRLITPFATERTLQ